MCVVPLCRTGFYRTVVPDPVLSAIWHDSSLKSAVEGVFPPWKLANAIKQGF